MEEVRVAVLNVPFRVMAVPVTEGLPKDVTLMVLLLADVADIGLVLEVEEFEPAEMVKRPE